jgi:hypothetical protein
MTLAAEESIDIQEVAEEVLLRLLAMRKHSSGCPQTEMEDHGD